MSCYVIIDLLIKSKIFSKIFLMNFKKNIHNSEDNT